MEPTQAPRTLLLVEDDRDQREMYTELLEERGFVVFAAEGLGQAKRIIEEHCWVIDTVIADNKLLDGEGAALREVCRDLKIKFFLMSGLQSQDTDFVKPVKWDSVLPLLG